MYKTFLDIPSHCPYLHNRTKISLYVECWTKLQYTPMAVCCLIWQPHYSTVLLPSTLTRWPNMFAFPRSCWSRLLLSAGSQTRNQSPLKLSSNKLMSKWTSAADCMCLECTPLPSSILNPSVFGIMSSYQGPITVFGIMSSYQGPITVFGIMSSCAVGPYETLQVCWAHHNEPRKDNNLALCGFYTC